MKIEWMLSAGTALAIVSLCSPASAESHYPITPRLVARALSYQGIQTADEQVSLPAQVVATEPYPALDVLEVEPPAANPLMRSAKVATVRLACHEPGECLPFIALVASASAMGAMASQQTNVTPAGPHLLTSITMRAGTHAVLVLDDQVAHIQIAVVSMENGSTGKWIRVASPDHKQFYRGEVVSSNQLRGAF